MDAEELREKVFRLVLGMCVATMLAGLSAGLTIAWIVDSGHLGLTGVKLAVPTACTIASIALVLAILGNARKQLGR